jgi:hypothetical protein
MDQAMTLLIRERAYHIWAVGGGDSDGNWLQAETKILQLTSPQSAPASAPKPKARGSRNRKSVAATKVS